MLVFGTLKGIVVAIIVSLIGLASQTAHPRVSVIGRKRGADVLRPLSPEHPDDETFEGLLIVRPEGRLFFVNAQNVAEQIDALVAQHKPRVLALDMSRVPDIEYSALQMLMEGEKRATERGAVGLAGGAEPRRARGRAQRRAGRATRPRAHAVQRARGDRALPGAAGEGDRGGAPCRLLSKISVSPRCFLDDDLGANCSSFTFRIHQSELHLSLRDSGNPSVITAPNVPRVARETRRARYRPRRPTGCVWA